MAKEVKKTKTKAPGTVTNTPPKRRQEVVGVVVSDKMHKTISVQVFALNPHAQYGKFIRQSNVHKAHDEKNEAKVGDRVRIFATRPLSKTKRWALAEIVEKRRQVEGVDV